MGNESPCSRSNGGEKFEELKKRRKLNGKVMGKIGREDDGLPLPNNR